LDRQEFSRAMRSTVLLPRSDKRTDPWIDHLGSPFDQQYFSTSFTAAGACSSSHPCISQNIHIHLSNSVPNKNKVDGCHPPPVETNKY
jgi:hypothetical protein